MGRGTKKNWLFYVIDAVAALAKMYARECPEQLGRMSLQRPYLLRRMAHRSLSYVVTVNLRQHTSRLAYPQSRQYRIRTTHSRFPCNKASHHFRKLWAWNHFHVHEKSVSDPRSATTSPPLPIYPVPASASRSRSGMYPDSLLTSGSGSLDPRLAGTSLPDRDNECWPPSQTRNFPTGGSKPPYSRRNVYPLSITVGRRPWERNSVMSVLSSPPPRSGNPSRTRLL